MAGNSRDHVRFEGYKKQTEECLASAQVLPLCEAGVWRCPSCLDLCNCSGRSCSRFQKGLEPTEQLHSEAVRQGFKSVRAALLGIRFSRWWLPRFPSSRHACARHGTIVLGSKRSTVHAEVICDLVWSSATRQCLPFSSKWIWQAGHNVTATAALFRY